MRSTKGLTIIYVGDGKGKTTASIGTAFRASGSGMNVCILQFIKGEWPSGERDFIKVFSQMKIPKNNTIGQIKIIPLGRGFVKILGDKKPFTVHKKAAKLGLSQAKKIMKSKKYDLVIFDELLSAYEENLINLSDIIKIINLKPKNLHIIITGHKLPLKLKKYADLITEMKMIKHPYYSGVLAQRGIDY